MDIGLFCDFKLPTKSEIQLLQDLRVTDVYLGMNDQERSSFFLRWNRFRQSRAFQRLVDTGLAIADTGINVHLMPWLRPSKEYNEQAAEICLPAAEKIGAKSILFDVEVYWNKRGLPRRFDHEEAVEEYWRPVWADSCIPYGVTSYALLPLPVVALVNEPEVTYCIPQAYSVWSDRLSWAQKPQYAPGPMQRLGALSWRKHMRPDQELIMGLAAYYQRRPGMTGKQAVLKAMDESSKYCDLCVFWSLKHVKRSRVMQEIIKDHTACSCNCCRH